MSSLNLVANGLNFRISNESSQVSAGSPEEGNEQLPKSLPSAPKGKPKAPPLIQEKVRPDAKELNHNQDEAHTTESSAVPLKKSKSSSSEFKNELQLQSHQGKKFQWQGSGASSGGRSARSKDSEESRGSLGGRSQERVKLARGIEMKRIVQDTNSSRFRRTYSSIPQPSTNSGGKTSHGHLQQARQSQGQNPRSSSRSRKMKRSAVCPPDVKVKGFLEDHHSGTNIGRLSSTVTTSIPELANSNNNENSNTTVSTKSKEEIKEEEKPCQEFIRKNSISADPCNGNGTAAVPTEGATLEEFLKMPKTQLPETEAQKQKPDNQNQKPENSSSGNKKLYKSKFWGYLRPSKSSSDSSKKRDQKKPYDPEEVKTFMQKQKEIRKQEQMKKSREKQEEYERKQRMLKELESKCQRQLRGRQRHSEVHLQNEEHNDTSPTKKSKLHEESPSLKYLKPLLERKHGVGFLKRPGSSGGLERKSEAAKQAQYLLSEFENIVKRECISFLNQIPQPLVAESSPVQKVDKAVGTNGSISDVSQSSKSDSKKKSSVEDTMSNKRFPPSPTTVEKAAMKIQASWRGHKVRKALREAKVNLRRQFLRHNHDLLRNDERVPIQYQSMTHANRRWSLPSSATGFPEKPYASSQSASRVTPMSPVHFFGQTGSPTPCYIPPPSPAASQSAKSQMRPRVLPSIALTPLRHRVYDEPYPKLAPLTPSKDLLTQGQNHNLSYTKRLSSPPAPSTCYSLSRKIENLPIPKSNSLTPNTYDFSIPSAQPSVLDAFREKLNIFKNQVEDQNLPQVVQLHPSPPAQNLAVGSQTQRTSPARVHGGTIASYSTDFESVTDTNTAAESKPCSTVSDEIVETPRLKKKHRKHHSRPRSHSQHGGHDSTPPVLKSAFDSASTTIESEAGYPSSTSKKGNEEGGSQSQSIMGSNSAGTLASSNSVEMTATRTNSLGGLLAPALRLRYEAERERLKVIEKALNVSLKAPNVNQALSTASSHQKKSGSETQANTKRNNANLCSSEDKLDKAKSRSSESVQYAIAKVQKESLRAAAEMAKWMAEFQKSTQEQEKLHTQKSSVDLAAMVYAAVEEARYIGKEKRRAMEKKGKAQKMEQIDNKIQEVNEYDSAGISQSSLTVMDEEMKAKSECSQEEIKETEVGEALDKEDKSVQTSLLVPDYKFKEAEGKVSFSSSSEHSLKDERYLKIKSLSSLEKTSQQQNDFVAEETEHDVSEEIIQQDDVHSELEESQSDREFSKIEQVSQVKSLEKELIEMGSVAEEYTEPNLEVESEAKTNESREPERPESDEEHSVSFIEEVEEELEPKSQSISEFETKSDSIMEPSPTPHSKDSEPEKPIQQDAPSQSELEESQSDREFSKIEQDSQVKTLEEEKIEMGSVAEEYSEPNLEVESEVGKNESREPERPESDEEHSVSLIEEGEQELEPKSQSMSEKSMEVEVDLKPDSILELSEPEKVCEVEVSPEHSIEQELEPKSQSMSEKSMEVEIDLKPDSITESPSTKHSQLSEPETPIQSSPAEEGKAPESEKVPEVEISTEHISEHELESKAQSLSEKSMEVEVVLKPDSIMEPPSTPHSKLSEPEKVPEVEDSIDHSSEEQLESKSQSLPEKSIEVEVDLKPESYMELSSTPHFTERVPGEEVSPEHSIEEELEHKSPSLSEKSMEVDLKPDSAMEPQSNPHSKLSEPEPSIQSSPAEAEEEKTPESGKVSEVEVSTEHSIEKELEPKSQSLTEKSIEVEIDINTDSTIQSSSTSHSKLSESEKPVQSSPLQEEKVPEPEKVPEEDVTELEPVPVFTSKPQHSVQLQEEIIPGTEIILKPPPPYSPSSSLDSTSLSSRALMFCLGQDTLERVITYQVETMWPNWTTSGGLPSFQSLLTLKLSSSKEEYSVPVSDTIGNKESLSSAIENFDAMLWNLVYQTIRESLQGEGHSISYIEQVRPGPLALKAQSLKVPRSKQSLISQVLSKLLKTIPSTFFRDPPEDTPIQKSRKWCSRPRELVDEILLEELEKENYQWTEWWPEEKIIIQNATNNIIHNLIRNALEKRTYVYEQGWPKCLSFKYDVYRGDSRSSK